MAMSTSKNLTIRLLEEPSLDTTSIWHLNLGDAFQNPELGVLTVSKIPQNVYVHIRCLQHKSIKNKPFHLCNHLQLTIVEDIVREIQYLYLYLYLCHSVISNTLVEGTTAVL